MLTEHEPLTSVQVPPGVKVTVPVGVTGVPTADASATVAEHVRATPTVPLAGQLTVVDVARRLAVTVAWPELVPCVESPP